MQRKSHQHPRVQTEQKIAAAHGWGIWNLWNPAQLLSSSTQLPTVKNLTKEETCTFLGMGPMGLIVYIIQEVNKKLSYTNIAGE